MLSGATFRRPRRSRKSCLRGCLFRLGHSPPSYAQGIGFTSSASVTPLHPMHRAQDSRQSSLLVVTMHRAQDRANPPRPPASILCTGHRIHEFRLVTRSILCTGHRIHRFRAGFPSHEEGTGFTTGDIPYLHYAQGTGSCKSSPTTHVYPMHRAKDSRVPRGHSLDPMHRAQDSQVPRRFSILCTVHRIPLRQCSSQGRPQATK